MKVFYPASLKTWLRACVTVHDYLQYPTTRTTLLKFSYESGLSFQFPNIFFQTSGRLIPILCISFWTCMTGLN